MNMWELVARETIRDGLARYNWAGDAGRLTDLAATFAENGVLEIRGGQVLRGRGEIAAFLGGVKEGLSTRPETATVVRHHVTNVLFAEVTETRAQVSCYFAVFTHVGLDHFGRYRDTFTRTGDDWLIEYRKASTDWVADDSVMARPRPN
jgi:hypothetical protein